MKIKISDDLQAVGREAQRLGCTAYLVGGVVRDLLLKRASTDWDIVVEGDALELAKAIAGAKKAKVIVYKQFGTATVTFTNGKVMDFATCRSEHYAHPGALPVVNPGTIKEDLFRRDFTINALAVVLNPNCLGELQDFYHGYDDLTKKKIRIMNDESFVDDPTRILRAVRFATRFGFHLETKTRSLLKDALRNNATMNVKPPRYFSEFRKIFLESHPARCLEQLAELNGLDFIHSDFQLDKRLLIRLEKKISQLKKDTFYRAKDWSKVFLLALLSGLSPEKRKHLSTHFHLTRAESVSLAGLKEVRALEKKLQILRLFPSEIYEILDPVDLEIIYFIRAVTSVNIVGRRVDEFLKKWRLVSLQITGDDLKSMGFKPGKEMGALLHTLLLKKIDGEIKNHKGEIMLAQRLGIKRSKLDESN